jgi:hypothetical protein
MSGNNFSTNNKNLHNYGGISTMMDISPMKPSESPTGKSWGGIPYEGRKMNIKDSDPEHKKPRLQKTANCKIFNMEDPEQAKEYRLVMQKCVNNAAQTTVKEILSHQSPLRIYLEWYDLLMVPPTPEK